MVAANQHTGYLSKIFAIEVKIYICNNCAVKHSAFNTYLSRQATVGSAFCLHVSYARTKMLQICGVCLSSISVCKQLRDAVIASPIKLSENSS